MNEFSPFSKRSEPGLITAGQEGIVVVDLPYRRIQTILATVTLTIIALGIFRQVWIHWYGSTTALGKMQLIYLDGEGGAPEWWSVLQFLLAAVLLKINGVVEPTRRWKLHWSMLAAILVYLSFDEAVGIHELVTELLAPYHFTGFLAFSWVIPYAIACLVVGALYVPFVFALPRGIRWSVIFTGGLFVAAAMGGEMIGAYCATIGNGLCYQLAVIAEESGEIVAIGLFILALLALLESRHSLVALKFSGSALYDRSAQPAPSFLRPGG